MITADFQVKEEPVERETLFTCQNCQLHFREASTRDAHRDHYCHRTGKFSILRASQIKPLDLSKDKQTYACGYCSIRFRSMKVLHAHQENYCRKYR